MGLLDHFSKPKKVRQFERTLKKGRYADAWRLCRSGHLPAPLQAEAQYKLAIYDAIASVALGPQFQDKIAAVASRLQNKSIIETLPNPEQSTIRLAQVATALKTGATDAALDRANQIRDKEARSQAIRRVAGHMACRNLPWENTVQVITTIPIAAYANEELRNLLLSRVLLKEFDAARKILPQISQEIRRGLRPQVDFVERHHDNLEHAQKRAEGMIHPDDIALTLALVAGAMGEHDWMLHFSRSVSAQLRVGTHATYSMGLAYAGKFSEAVMLLESIFDNKHEYYLHLSHLAYNFALNTQVADGVCKVFATAERYEGALAHWYHLIMEHLITQNIDEVCDAIRAICNDNLRKALAILVAEFAYGLEAAMVTK